jgi:hypothetical protein
VRGHVRLKPVGSYSGQKVTGISQANECFERKSLHEGHYIDMGGEGCAGKWALGFVGNGQAYEVRLLPSIHQGAH